MMAKWLGHRPIVVPRLARFGEVVDDHQVTFGRQLASEGDVVIAESEASLAAALDQAVASPPPPRSQGPSLPMTDAVARLADLVEGLVSSSRRKASR
jgi:UDP-N-acetylglucosamine transferase subunit ALG13